MNDLQPNSFMMKLQISIANEGGGLMLKNDLNEEKDLEPWVRICSFAS